MLQRFSKCDWLQCVFSECCWLVSSLPAVFYRSGVITLLSGLAAQDCSRRLHLLDSKIVEYHCLMQIYRLRKNAQAVSTSFVAKFAHVCTIHIHTIYSGKRKRSANCLCFPVKGNFYFRELRKVRCTSAISRSHVCCCCCESSLNHFIFIAYRMSLRLAIRATQEEAGERVTM